MDRKQHTNKTKQIEHSRTNNLSKTEISDLTFTTINPNNQQILQTTFRELKQRYRNRDEIYTDGSKINDITVHSVTDGTTTISSRILLLNSTIFTAEMDAAIAEAILIAHRNEKDTVIYTVSLASIYAIGIKKPIRTA